MKYIKKFCIVLLFLTTLLSSCTLDKVYSEYEVSELVDEAESEAYSRGYEAAYEDIYYDAFAEGRAEGEEDGYEQGYDHGYESAWDDSNIEEIEDYYERLCDKYGYLSYDELYHAYSWSKYIVWSDFVYHTDWCCADFNHSSNYSRISAKQISSSYTQCTTCADSKSYYFLDENDGIFHASAHLALDTDDFISPTITYQLVSYDAAIACGYLPCPECGDRMPESSP